MQRGCTSHRRGFARVIWACVLTAFVWAGNAGAETMTHQSHGTALPAGSASGSEDIVYSLFMHHSSGAALIVLGVLVLTDRLTNRRYGAFQIGIGVTWLLLGAHLFIKADLEGWPVGPNGFVESFWMPTAGEWLQHKLLSLIPLALGIWTFVSRRVDPHPFWSYALGAVLALGGVALLIHQHLDHQSMDLVNLQHRLMALTVFFIGVCSAADGLRHVTWKAKPFLLPGGLIVLGLQLALYIE